MCHFLTSVLLKKCTGKWNYLITFILLLNEIGQICLSFYEIMLLKSGSRYQTIIAYCRVINLSWLNNRELNTLIPSVMYWKRVSVTWNWNRVRKKYGLGSDQVNYYCLIFCFNYHVRVHHFTAIISQQAKIDLSFVLFYVWILHPAFVTKIVSSCEMGVVPTTLLWSQLQTMSNSIDISKLFPTTMTWTQLIILSVRFQTRPLVIDKSCSRPGKYWESFGHAEGFFLTEMKAFHWYKHIML